MAASAQLPVPPWLPPFTSDLIQRAVVALQHVLGDRLLACVLVGAAMNPARPDRHQNPEILAIVSEPGDLGLLAQRLQPVMAKGARVRLLTERELAKSCDVFALEIADWQARHRLLFGSDPLAGLQVKKADLRHGVETELRGLSRRIRNRVLTGLATRSERDDPVQAVRDGVDRFTVAGYHALRLIGEEPPRQEGELLTKVCARAGTDAAPLLLQLQALRSGQKVVPLEALAALLAVVTPVTDWIDGLDVAA